MGKRKSKARVMKKAAHTVSTVFDCPFCNHAQTCEVTINKAAAIGQIQCRICDSKYQCQTDSLSDPIDVYSEWIDECEIANAKEKAEDAEE